MSDSKKVCPVCKTEVAPGDGITLHGMMVHKGACQEVYEEAKTSLDESTSNDVINQTQLLL